MNEQEKTTLAMKETTHTHIHIDAPIESNWWYSCLLNAFSVLKFDKFTITVVYGPLKSVFLQRILDSIDDMSSVSSVLPLFFLSLSFSQL